MYKCKICGTEFDNPNRLSGHLSAHSRIDGHRIERPTCLCCGASLSRLGMKFCSNKCQHEYEQIEWEKKWLSGEVDGNSKTTESGGVRDRIRTYLFRKYDSKCAACGWGEINHFTGKIPLDVEHIDGNYLNNSPSNVTLLCPNCHSLTSTYKGANKGRGRQKR